MNQRSRTDWLLLASFCAFLFFWGLSYFGLIGADEPRYAQVAREMLARHDWITPTLGGKPWLEKPALYYWQAMLAYQIFGLPNFRREGLGGATAIRDRRNSHGICRLPFSSPLSPWIRT